MGLFGDLVKQATGGFASKPDVPAAPNVNPQIAQNTAIGGNLASMPELDNLATSVNTSNVAQRKAMVDSAIPGFENLAGSESNLLGDWLAGRLSPDVASAVQRGANAQAYQGGYGGSGMANNLAARNFGLTSQDEQKMGVSALPGYVNTVAGVALPRQFDPTTEFMTPQEQIAAMQYNENNRFSRDWLQNQLNAIPDPATAAISGDLGSMADTTASMIPYFGTWYGATEGSGSGGQGLMGGGGGGGGFFDQLMGMGGGGGGGGGGAGMAMSFM